MTICPDQLGVLDLERDELVILASDETPPCEAQVDPDDDVKCGKPSIARILFTCHDCGYSEPIFICAECLDALANHRGVRCSDCLSPGYTWREL